MATQTLSDMSSEVSWNLMVGRRFTDRTKIDAALDMANELATIMKSAKDATKDHDIPAIVTMIDRLPQETQHMLLSGASAPVGEVLDVVSVRLDKKIEEINKSRAAGPLDAEQLAECQLFFGQLAAKLQDLAL